MSAQGLEAIDHTVHLTHEWINELAARLDWSSKRCTLRLLRATLQQLRDHLMVDEMAQFAAQLPLLVRGIFFEGWVPGRTSLKERSIDAFVKPIERKMDETAEYRGREDITNVFELLNSRISIGEIEDIRASLPAPIRNIWPAP